MQNELIHVMTDTFEGHAQQTENGIEYWLARDLQHLLGYAKWDNFEGVIKRTAGIIKHGHQNGLIEKTYTLVKIGSGASRRITDYKLDREAVKILKELCRSYKLNNYFSIRNESVLMQLVEKYCREKKILFVYQFRLKDFIFDAMIDGKILVEFDEPHHLSCSRQKKVDTKKDLIATQNNFVLFRVNIEMDIIDLVIFIDETLTL